MNPLAIVGAFIITLSFLAYGIGSISLVRFKIVGNIVLIFLTMGILFDIAAIVLMVFGARGTPFTLHGFLGAAAFLIMLVDAVWCWKVYYKNGLDSKATNKHIKFTKAAYFFWVVAYFTGCLIILWR
ncbi:hypothetical protein [uncultured Draconibacterium sp.]|uniref:hypothetical protein n=1 Tax=uncultured Draconibacterium sp. TaxID=1573823 RepID=UPI0025E23EEA|nr:hypothetical protein [uncultured Draconibacterium sp.]